MYSLHLVRIKRGTTNQSSEISYSALPLETRGDLERSWGERYGLTRWCPLEPRLDSEIPVEPARLREIAQAMLADVAEAWEGTATELAVVVRSWQSERKLVERLQVTKGEERTAREKAARKLGKGVTHSRYGITLNGTHDNHATWEAADAFIRARLTAEELRRFRVQWRRDYGWDQFDNTQVKTHTVYADAEHLFEDRAKGLVGSTAWLAVRGTLEPEVAENAEALSQDWHGTGLELLEAARGL
jgi:hypothetical protein